MRSSTLWFLALGLAVALAACGDDDGGGDDPTDAGSGEDTGTGPRDAGTDTGRPPMDAGPMDSGSMTLFECDPLAEDPGCDEGEKCSVVIDQSDPDNVELVLACVPDSLGTKGAGVPCSFGDPTPDLPDDELYADDCGGGLFCFRQAGDTVRRCETLCGDCPESAFCNTFSSMPPLGVCTEAEGCDPVFQTGCDEGLNCYLIPNTLGDRLGACFEFVPEMDGGTGAPGEACTFINNCARGSQCFPEFFPDGGASEDRTCRQFCNAGPATDGGVPDDAGPAMDGGVPSDAGPTFTGECEGGETCMEIPALVDGGTTMVPTTTGACY